MYRGKVSILLNIVGVYVVYLTSQCTEPFLIQWLREYICQLIFSSNMADLNVFALNMISKKMETNIDMLRSRVLPRIVCNFDSTLIITKQRDFLHINTIIFQRLFEPKYLSAA